MRLWSFKRVSLSALAICAFSVSGCGTKPDLSSSQFALVDANDSQVDADALRKKAQILYYGQFEGKMDTRCMFQMVAGTYGQPVWSYSAYANVPGVDGMLRWGSIRESEFLGKIVALNAEYRKTWSDTSGELNPFASDHSVVVELKEGVPVRTTHIKTNMHFPAIKTTFVCDQFTPANL